MDSKYKNRNKEISCIDEMEALLDQIEAFKEIYPDSKRKTDPNYSQEFRLFQQHITWLSEDLLKPAKYPDTEGLRNK